MDTGVAAQSGAPARLLRPRGRNRFDGAAGDPSPPSRTKRTGGRHAQRAQARNVQIVVESHSEHLLRRLQRRVAECTADPDDVKLYFVSAPNGVAQASDLSLNRYGEAENWPEGFFGDEVGEVAAIAKEGLTRRIREQSG